jgi:hypothetical protein
LAFLATFFFGLTFLATFFAACPTFFTSGFGASAGASSGVPISGFGAHRSIGCLFDDSFNVVHIEPPSVDNARTIER